MGRIVERKVTETADYTLEITQANGEVSDFKGIGSLRYARIHAKRALEEGAVMVQIYACDYFNSPPELVECLNGVNKIKLKCDNCREFRQGVEDYYRGDTSNFYCPACATELGEV